MKVIVNGKLYDSDLQCICMDFSEEEMKAVNNSGERNFVMFPEDTSAHEAHAFSEDCQLLLNKKYNPFLSEKLSKDMIYVPEEQEDFMQMWGDNIKRLTVLDKKARDNNTILGRYITEPVADGNAIYQITEINVGKARQVRIKVCTGVGDDWVLPYWGEETLIDKYYAEGRLARKDAMHDFMDRDG